MWKSQRTLGRSEAKRKGKVLHSKFVFPPEGRHRLFFWHFFSLLHIQAFEQKHWKQLARYPCNNCSLCWCCCYYCCCCWCCCWLQACSRVTPGTLLWTRPPNPRSHLAKVKLSQGNAQLTCPCFWDILRWCCFCLALSFAPSLLTFVMQSHQMFHLRKQILHNFEDTNELKNRTTTGTVVVSCYDPSRGDCDWWEGNTGLPLF